MAKTVKASLADKIADVLSAAPSNFDEEENIAADNTEAKILETSELNEEDDNEELLLSNFRKQNLDLLADVDQRYAGKSSSRKRLRESSSSEEEDEESMKSEEELLKSDDSESGDEDDSQNESDEPEEGSSASENSDFQSGDEKSTEIDSFKHLNETNASGAVRKAVSVRNQMKRYEKMLEMRIHLQKCMKAANCMPSKAELQELQSDSNFNKSYSQTRDKLLYTLDRLLLLQKMVLDRCPDLKKSKETQGKSEKADSEDEDEEIPSDTEEEEVSEEKEDEPQKKKRRTLSNYEKELLQRHHDYLSYRNSIIKSWNEKTRLAIAKSGSASHSVIDQIEHSLKDKQRLIRRTQLKRSDYKIIGSGLGNADEEYNNEIFDDDDFYHQQLRELIEVKSADITDPVQLGRQWIQLQSMRSKMKRNIDTRATKGRKIRYAVHSKLVNFMAPVEDNSWTDEAKNELFNSVFGKTA